MSPSQKAHETKYYRAAREIVAAMLELQQPTNPAYVLDVWQKHKSSRAVKRDAFTLLDNESHRFFGSSRWHPELRQLRNHTTLGPQLLALF